MGDCLDQLKELTSELKAILYWIENILLKQQLDEKEIYEHTSILNHYKHILKAHEKSINQKTLQLLKLQTPPLSVRFLDYEFKKFSI